ncbi:uncharacterized protein BCR38DRAFT_487917 [Pseudomassariella vexata]|uniref:Uncharacterized protein n=1 Tax=Pseudomassariella vexata TaxID=1141098 RepID=A0A1Y2DNJ0_9PEZI|nr:uncharacterized protein BCR38DRAFT_487917 [Pseudomassariella vexata]ORY60858.1 hypothetical protein BCR38DRAFT_487917 [Pseudomassariella vexata]
MITLVFIAVALAAVIAQDCSVVDEYCCPGNVVLPSIQLNITLPNDSTAPTTLLNVPLFDDDCLYHTPSQAVYPGSFAPSAITGIAFSSFNFVDATGNPLDQRSLTSFLGFVSLCLGSTGATMLSAQDLFSHSLVVCNIKPDGEGQRILDGVSFGSEEIVFVSPPQRDVAFYACCIDYGGDNCADQVAEAIGIGT